MGLEWGFSGGRAIDVFFVEVVVGVFEWVDFVCGDVVVFVDVDFAFDGDYFDEVFVFDVDFSNDSIWFEISDNLSLESWVDEFE